MLSLTDTFAHTVCTHTKCQVSKSAYKTGTHSIKPVFLFNDPWNLHIQHAMMDVLPSIPNIQLHLLVLLGLLVAS